MPTDTFFRLPDQKRARLTNAICRELSRAPLSEYSINRVVQDAGVPRGSYYQYFENRDDVFFYVAETFISGAEQMLRLLLSENNGDLFEALPKLFDRSVEYLLSQYNRQLAQNIVSEMKTRGFPFRPPNGCHGAERLLPPELDRTLFDAKTEADCLEIALLAVGQYGTAVLETLDGEDAPSARTKLVKRLRYLEFGARRKNA